MSSDSSHAYWRANLGLVGFCLTIWAIVSYGFGILLRPMLDSVSLGGYKLGFWFAQQGSMYVFLLLIAFYAIRMKAIDRKFDVHDD